MNNNNDDFKVLHSDNWDKSSWQEKLEALQKLENFKAIQQNREPYTIELKQYKNDQTNGTCDDEKGINYLNENLLKESREFSNYRCIEAIFHEGRHAYQHIVCEKKVEHSNEKEIAEWTKNEIFYVKGKTDRFIYGLQPKEMDARRYALAELEKFYNELEKTFGKDENVINYLNERKNEEQKIINDAIKKYGQDYLLGIEKDIDKLHYESKLDRAKGVYEGIFLKPLKDELNNELDNINQQQQDIHANIIQKKLNQKEIELAREQLGELKSQEKEVQNELYQLSQALHSPEAQKKIEEMAQTFLKLDQELYRQKLEKKVDISNKNIINNDQSLDEIINNIINQKENSNRQLTHVTNNDDQSLDAIINNIKAQAQTQDSPQVKNNIDSVIRIK